MTKLHIIEFIQYSFISSTLCPNILSARKVWINTLTPELNPSSQRCLTRFITGDFSTWTVHFVNVCVKNQQMQQLFIQFINYVWYLLYVSALHCNSQRAFLVPSERYSIEEQSIEYCGWELPYKINKLNECLMYLLVFHAYFYWRI
jgi:hypothetical protein